MAIYSDRSSDIEEIKSIIQDFLIETKTMAKVSIFNDPEEFIIVPNRYDIYIMDVDSKENVFELGKQMMEIDTGSHFIYVSSNESDAFKSSKVKADYFLLKPLDKEETSEILKDIKKRIQEDSIIIKIASGERRVRVNHLNYINIVKRCLCYHLKDGTMFDGQTLRSSFEKAISPLPQNKVFLFLPPSLLINLGEVKIVNADNLIFENDEVLFFPKKAHDIVRNAWATYNRILD